MIVVSNTSPLTNLAAIGHFDLLSALYGEVHISEAVWQELNADGRRWPGCDEVAAAAWIHRHPLVEDLLARSLGRDVHPGEAESIALASRIGAGLIILDDRAARDAAENLGLNVIGILGVLLEAKARGHIHQVKPLLDALRDEAGFYLGPRIVGRVLELAGE